MASRDDTRARLDEVYRRLYARFGPQHWWPHSSGGAFEIIVGAILTQNTAWTNVEQALANLRSARLLTPTALQHAPTARLARLIRPSGYFNLKAKKLKAFTRFLFTEHHGRLAHLFVASFHGISGLVLDVGPVAGATRCAAVCCGGARFLG